MGKITLGQAAAWCGGRVDPKYADITFLGANNDTRKIEPGQLFIVLEGARDGHDFIPAAMEKGAAAVLCRRSVGDYPAIYVEDPRLALGQIAHRERQRIGMQVVGVTGSVGKSTTKEMIACVLEGSYRVAKTPANHNNDIGMPMAILAMPEDTQVAVLEMGMNHFGEIAYLSKIACPDVGVIVNIGTMHIEHLGSRDGILRAKMEITQGMTENSVLLLNGDDDKLSTQTGSGISTVFFGRDSGLCKVLGCDTAVELGQTRFTVRSGSGEFPVELAVEGEHYITDALAAVAVGQQLGVAPEQLRLRLGGFQNMEGRQQIYEKKGFTIIEDCYNAGPESMAAALQVLGNRGGRRIAVLGDMLELGASSQAEHYRVGRIAAEKADMVFAYGANANRVASGALTGGMPEKDIGVFDDAMQLAASLRNVTRKGDVLLFKGSRGMRMELILNDFLEKT
ncbi:MAG: UDP-N-acetylmuramoyl-tripeptide--D-alanyl-D-alanine ligase [Oscillospiraceae bacterium]|nr:UDP-N-acetylmuramoyl-tripeptide--D-alanyl-D-alanine ligase [Oscillospiraceae bacterium]